ncbi:MAG: hypothetical protein IPO86_04330 [Saprospiraceae bacterium]|nr:hypothetical protein [Saprospiraceae bacterium]MBK9727329.1 hypothetical protein [Saprospiraceae bacterium]
MQRFKIAFLLFVFISCEEDSYKMDRKIQFKADSLFVLEEQLLTKKLDSICLENQKSRKQNLLDSIVEIRKQEIIQFQKGL